MNEQHRQELAELHLYFQSAKFPAPPFHLNKYLIVSGDPLLTIQKSIDDIQNHTGSDAVRESLFAHLRQMKALCEAQ